MCFCQGVERILIGTVVWADEPGTFRIIHLALRYIILDLSCTNLIYSPAAFLSRWVSAGVV